MNELFGYLERRKIFHDLCYESHGLFETKIVT